MNSAQAKVLRDKIAGEFPGAWVGILPDMFGDAVWLRVYNHTDFYTGVRVVVTHLWTFTCPEEYERKRLDILLAMEVENVPEVA